MEEYTLSYNKVRIPVQAVCQFSNIEPSKTVTYQNVEHVGTVAHRCVLYEGNKDECECKCKTKFTGWR